jgi:hypothetical protein
LYYYIFYHYSLIPILTNFTFLPFLVLQSIVLPPNYSFGTFSYTVSSCFPLPFLSLPTYHHTTPLPHTYHLLTNILYQLCTPSVPHSS